MMLTRRTHFSQSRRITLTIPRSRVPIRHLAIRDLSLFEKVATRRFFERTTPPPLQGRKRHFKVLSASALGMWTALVAWEQAITVRTWHLSFQPLLAGNLRFKFAVANARANFHFRTNRRHASN